MSPGSDPRADLHADLYAAAEAAVRQARAVRERAADEQESIRAARNAALADLQRRARSGELGPDLRRLAARVDQGRSSWPDIIRGIDTSASAQDFRRRVSRSTDRSTGEAGESVAG